MRTDRAAVPIACMHREYGEVVGRRCGSCCNCQQREYGSESLICVAYGEADWDRNYSACEKLFNYPFYALRPRIDPLEKLLGKYKARSSVPGEIEGQGCLF